MKRILFVAALLVACHHEKKEDISENTVTRSVDAETERDTEQDVRHQDATDIETKTEIDDNAVMAEEPDGGIVIAAITPRHPLALPKGSKVLGVVPLTTKKVDQDKKVGAVTDQKNISGDKTKTVTDDSNSHKTERIDDIHDAGPGFKFYIWITVIVIILLLAGLGYLKFGLKVSWL